MKKKYQKIGVIISLVLFLGIFLWANLKRSNSKCTGLVVEIIKDNQLVNEELVRSVVNIQLESGEPEGVKLSKIDINDIEKALDSMPQIRKSHVFMDMYSKMNIQIIPQQPVLRIHDRQGDQFYITKDSSVIKTFVNTVVDVPIASGFILDKFVVGEKISSPLSNDLYQLALVINKDKLLKAQIEQIYIDNSGEINLIPLVGNHIIVLGNCDNLSNKLERLKQFYHKGLNKVGWRKYKKIILKYDKQVVCK